MDETNPDMLLQWLNSGLGEDRDMQLIALEELCMILLMTDDIELCFEKCEPSIFLPALCRIFVDEQAAENVLEVTARAITFYLDMAAVYASRIVAIGGVIKAICNRLVAAELSSRISKDLAEQCVKVLELISTREQRAVFDADGLNCILRFIQDNGQCVHKDTLHSAMVVASKLCFKVEPEYSHLSTCISVLTTLLRHEDLHVADGALKCFVTITEKFRRKGVDLVPLAQHGLVNELLNRLSNDAAKAINTQSTPGKSPSTNNMVATASNTEASYVSVSTIINLLSTLCIGSPTITHDLLRSELLDALEKSLKCDERCTLNSMKLVDLLLVLLFEGHGALAMSGYSFGHLIPQIKQMNVTMDKPKSLFNCIRLKNTEAFIEVLENDEIDINFMDHVGQTLLNWVSAFGTLEMVEYLCEKGADVNKGEQGSSLHYAACFGRPAIVKVLLRFGANPDLRDQDDQTPIEKARERAEEARHREVAAILQSPREWMRTVDRAQKNKNISEDSTEEPCGDPEMVPIYLQKLLPIVCSTFKSTMLHSIRKESLRLIKQMVYYIQSNLLEELCALESSLKFGTQIVEVIANVLDNEEDDDGHSVVLSIIQDLMAKSQETFLNHFARLGIFMKVENLAGLHETQDNVENESAVDTGEIEDAKYILSERAYHWQDWSICRGTNCLYIWSDAAALKLSNESNGWFSFIIDGKLQLMYSHGLANAGPDMTENEQDFLEKMQWSHAWVKCTNNSTPSTPILSKPGLTRLVVGNWSLTSRMETAICIQNSFCPQQAVILREDLPGFIFESHTGKKDSIIAKTMSGAEFPSGWSMKKDKRHQSKLETTKMKVKCLAHQIYEQYFRTAQAEPRGIVAKLRNIVNQIESACQKQCLHNLENGNSWKEILQNALDDLMDILKDDVVSAYELHSSGLVHALLSLFSTSYSNQRLNLNKMVTYQKKRSQIFKNCFKNKSNESYNPVSILVQKLIGVLDSIEKLPVYIYNTPKSTSGLQILTRRLKFRLEKAAGGSALIDRTGRGFQMEPLVTVAQLEEYLLKKLATKHWYDYDRRSLQFLKKLCDPKYQEFKYYHDFDENGLIYFIGTNGKISSEWVNPGEYGLVKVTSSDNQNLCSEKLAYIISRDPPALNRQRSNDKRSWFRIDLGVYIIPTAYTIRKSNGYWDTALRNWHFQMSKDGNTWTTLYTHMDDTSLNDSARTATWPIEVSPDEYQGWRYVQIKRAGEDLISLYGFEIYGKVISVSDDISSTLSLNPESVNISVLSNLETDKENPKRRKMYSPKSSNCSSDTDEDDTNANKLQMIPATTSGGIPTTTEVVQDASQAITMNLPSTSSTSEPMFFDELCRARYLLDKLNDEEIVEDEEKLVFINPLKLMKEKSSQGKHWDDKYILKGVLPALIPAFDPTPGRTNVNHITDLEVPPPGQEESNVVSIHEQSSQIKLQLALKGPNIPGIVDIEVELNDPSWTIFRAVHELMQMTEFKTKQEKISRIWETTYTIIYREVQDDGTLHRMDEGHTTSVATQRCKSGSSSVTEEISSPRIPVPSTSTFSNCTVKDVLQLLRHIFVTTTTKEELKLLDHSDISPEQFYSNKIINKLLQQIKEPLVLSSSSLPAWCEELNHSCSFLFPFETRQLYFNCTAFGASRSMVWLQTQTDTILERHRIPGLPSRIDDRHDIRMGRLKIERVKVPRAEKLLDWAMQVMKIHANQKSILEVKFVGEEGTGIGPTLEFYNLVAAEIQRRDLTMWICDDEAINSNESIDLDEGVKPPGYYVRSHSGLFPAPLPQNSEVCDKAVKYFHFLGIFLAKTLQDNRLIDLPLSRSFLKLMCHRKIQNIYNERIGFATMKKTVEEDVMTFSEENEKVLELNSSKIIIEKKMSWYSNILGEEDLHDIDPIRANFLKQVRDLVKQKQTIMQDHSLAPETRAHQIQNLYLNDASGPVLLEDLALTFTYLPSSSVYGFTSIDLVDNGADIEVNIENVEEYAELTTQFCLDKGISRQLEAFYEGFSMVFQMEKLAAFSPDELCMMLCGDQNPEWTRENLINYTEPKLGYAKDSPTFLRFVNVLVEMTPEERKEFLQFVTGCSCLPPGGLANLYPRLTIVKKVNADEGSYPSVNTCLHYLKLPDYSTEEILRQRLLTATKQKSFYLN